MTDFHQEFSKNNNWINQIKKTTGMNGIGYIKVYIVQELCGMRMENDEFCSPMHSKQGKMERYI